MYRREVSIMLTSRVENRKSLAGFYQKFCLRQNRLPIIAAYATQ
jgi:hypothetical protein